MPHGHCYRWEPGVLWLNVGSDLAIALAYFSIPLALALFLRRRRDLRFRWILALFAAFIISCGLTHLVDVYTTWTGAYRLEGLLKAITALLSLLTAAMMWPVIPRLLEIPSMTELEAINARLRSKVEAFELAERIAQIGEWRLEFEPRAVAWSSEVYRIHGLDPAGPPPELSTAIEAYHPEDRDEVERAINEALDTRSNLDFELRILRPDGQVRWVQCLGVPVLDDEGELLRLHGVIRDVTQAHGIQRALAAEVAERTEDLRQANEDLESFAYAASHDLKEPLRMVSSYVSLLERRYADELDDKARRYIGHAVDGAQRMAKLIDRLLAFSRASRGDLKIETVNLAQVADEVVAELAVLARAREAQIDIDSLPEVETSLVVVRQVLSNLISNAIKYGGAPPRVRVGAELVEGGDRLRIRVEDNGEGVPEEQRRRIFEPFVRLHGSEHSPGSGMGLAICRRLVKRCGGHLRVADHEGGAAFELVLPVSGSALPGSGAAV